MTKTKINITIDPYILEEAKKKNLNISEICEKAVVRKIDPANISLEVTAEQEYPFEVCTTELPETFRTRLFGMCGIKAKRCNKCGQIFFVNDLHDEFKVCKNCSKVY